jgi:hypothetical protein
MIRNCGQDWIKIHATLPATVAGIERGRQDGPPKPLDVSREATIARLLRVPGVKRGSDLGQLTAWPRPADWELDCDSPVPYPATDDCTVAQVNWAAARVRPVHLGGRA